MNEAFLFWWYRPGSNQRHTDFQSVALPTELRYPVEKFGKVKLIFLILSKIFYKYLFMDIVIDFGNSRTKAGIVNNQKITDVFHFVNEQDISKEVESLITSVKPNTIAYLNVKPVPEELIHYFSQCGAVILSLHHKMPLPFKIHYRTPETLGVDRLAGVLGGYSMFPDNDFLVIQSGTCITYDLYLRGKGYMGGAISPGPDIRNRAMNSFTHQLPLVTTENIEHSEIIAENTNNALISGILNGALFEIEGFIKEAEKQSENLNVILSGGNTLYFAKKIKSQIFANSNITLTGLKEIIKLNEQTKI